MNPVRKIYCRIFQKCFHIAIPLLPYRTPKKLDSIKEIPGVLRKKRKKSVLLITDKTIRGFGITANLEKLLSDEGFKVTVYDETVANPTSANVEEARLLYKENKCDCLIGFGGGSSMDCAKAVGARIAKPHQPLEKMEGIMKILLPIPLLMAIPTTAGTGSETTVASVIVDSETRHKYPINDFPLIPKYAVLDPEVTRSLPPSVTATTGMDALTHAVEAYIGRSTTKGTRAASLKAVSLIFEYLPQAVANGNDMKARRKMLYASFLAGYSFTRSYVGYVHAVAHSLGGKYNIPHGLANAVLLPYVLEEYGESAYKKLHDLAVVAGLSGTDVSDEEGAKAFIDAVRKMQKDLNVGDKLSGIKEEDIPKLARYADKEGNPLYPVPKLMDAKELEKFYYAVME